MRKNFLIAVVVIVVLVLFSIKATAGTEVEKKAEMKSQDFSVWLIPSRKDGIHQTFTGCIVSFLADRKDAFEPHITLYWGKSSDLKLDNIKDTVSKIASGSKPVILTVNGIGITRERFKSLFLTFGKYPRLYEWSDILGKTSGVIKTGYILQPHMSLYYSPEGVETPAREKALMMRTIMDKHPEWFAKDLGKGEFVKGYEVEFDRIQVRIEYDENRIDKWEKLCEFTLTGNN